MASIKIKTVKLARSFEASIEIFMNLAWVLLVYLIFKWLTEHIIEGDINDILISMLLLPSLYIIKDSSKVITPWFVSVSIRDNSVSSITGVAPQIDDTLSLGKVDNIEVQVTPLGKVFNYGTIKLYSAGGAIEIPYVKDYLIVKEKIEERIKNCR